MSNLRRMAAAVVLVSLAAALPAHAQKATDSKRLIREISIMEKVIDQMLLDSPNLLVFSTEDNTRGLYLDEFGVLFSFQASLVDRKSPARLFNLNGLNIREKDGVIVIDTGDDSTKSRGKVVRKPAGRKGAPEESAEPPEPPEAPEPPEIPDMGPMGRRLTERQARLYAAGKAEIIDVLLDYGDTMNSLRDNQWLAVAAFLRPTDYFLSQKISRLVLKARMSDLRAYASNKITRDQMVSRVVQEEY